MDIYQQLSRQALGRGLSEQEQKLSEAIESIFASSVHEPEAVAAELNRRNVERPSGQPQAWNASILLDELRSINASLDDAYAKGSGSFSAGTR